MSTSYRPPNKPWSQFTQAERAKHIAEFERAVYLAYDCFPKPHYTKS